MSLHPALASLARRAAPRPAVVGPVADVGTLGWLEADPRRAAEQCDLLEFRLDGLSGEVARLERLAAAAEIPVLVTVRRPDEGGLDPGLGDDARRALYRRFFPVASFVDVELRSLPEMADVVAEARAAGVAVVLSQHDFSGQDPVPVLRERLAAMAEAGADVGKLAVTPRSWDEVFDLAAVAHDAGDGGPPARALMGMGPFGKLSRLLCASGGSALNYGYLRGANAPGQWPAAEFRRLLGELVPARSGG